MARENVKHELWNWTNPCASSMQETARDGGACQTPELSELFFEAFNFSAQAHLAHRF